LSEGPAILNSLLKEAADALRADWSRLVAIGCKLSKDKDSIDQISNALAKAGKSSQDSIKRKLFAIQSMQNLGYSEAEIAGMGQSTVLSEFQKTKKAETYEKQTVLKFMIPGSQREIVQNEIERVKRVLGMTTSEAFFDWFVAQLQQTTDDELKHAAGGAHHRG
jgi:hypothetical protein